MISTFTFCTLIMLGLEVDLLSVLADHRDRYSAFSS